MTIEYKSPRCPQDRAVGTPNEAMMPPECHRWPYSQANWLVMQDDELRACTAYWDWYFNEYVRCGGFYRPPHTKPTAYKAPVGIPTGESCARNSFAEAVGRWVQVSDEDTGALVMPITPPMDYDHIAGMISENC